MLILLGVVAVVGLILANGYFVAGEFAYVAVRRGPLEELAERGNRRAQRAVEVVRRLSFMLSGAQLGITATSLLVGYVAEPTLGRALEPLMRLVGISETAAPGVALAAGLSLATAAQMVFGELGPKNLAIAKPQPFALALAGSTRLWLRLAGPVISLFDSASNGLLRAVGITPVQELQAGVSAEELEVIIEHSGEAGSLTPGQTQLLSRALDFRDLRASEVMVARPQVVSLPVTATCDRLRAVAVDTGHSRFPVVGDGLDDIRGVVQAKDVFTVPAAQRATTNLSALMSPPLAVPESALVGALLGDLRRARSPLAVVVDEHGGTAGIATLEDIVEELVGEIHDEYDPAEAATHLLADGSYVVPGSWRVDETERDTGVALPEGDYETVSGLIMARLGRLPRVGDVVEVGRARLRVDALDGHAVGRVRLTPAASPASEAGDRS